MKYFDTLPDRHPRGTHVELGKCVACSTIVPVVMRGWTIIEREHCSCTRLGKLSALTISSTALANAAD